MATYYKYLDTDGVTPQGYGQWPLPTKRDDGAWEPGAWLPPIEGKLIACLNGYHVMEAQHLLEWSGPVLVEVQTKGSAVQGGDKCVVREARALRIVETWNERTQHLLAADIAEHVLAIFEKKHPADLRPRQIIETVRAFANGKATKEALAAAWEAAWAAGDAAWAAGDAAGDAGAAAWAAGAVRAVGAAEAAAWSARAAGAAGATTWAATRDAEREWQLARLQQYLSGEIQ